MSFKINHPVTGFTGTHSGLVFENGTAELDSILEDAAVAVLIDNGFTITGEASAKIPEGEPSADWTHDQIDAYAKDKGVSLSGSKSKDEKVALIVKSAEDAAAAAAKAADEAKAAAQ